MKKILALVMALTLVLGLFAGCSNSNSQKSETGEATASPSETAETPSETAANTTIKVGASITPHAEILETVVDAMAEKGYTLEIIQFTDYIQPNLALDSDDLDANYFQHQAYLDNFNEERGTNLVTVATIHYEPFAVYAGKLSSLDDLAEGTSIAIPNDGTNEARALLLLEDLGYVKLKEDAGVTATILDIEENTMNLDIIEMEAAQISNAVQDVDFVILNGNYAMQAGLSVDKDGLATEDEDSLAYELYPNVLVVNSGNENSPGIQALVECLTSDDVKTFMEETYSGAVVPVF